MLKILIIVLLSFTYLKSEWIDEGDYLKLNHDMTNISEMRYSIDTTHIILINSEQINYYNKYTGEFSKSFSVPVLSEISDTLKDFTNPILSIDEKIISYTNTVATSYNERIDIEEAYFDIKENKIIGKPEINYSGSEKLLSNNSYSFLISESKDIKFKLDNHVAQIPHGFSLAYYHIENNLTKPSSKRIETIKNYIKFNPINKAIATLELFGKNKYCIVFSQDSLSIGLKNNPSYNEYTEGIKNLKNAKNVFSFANDEEHIFITDDSSNILNKYNYKLDENNYYIGDFNYSKVYYLSDNKFLGQNGKDFYVLDGDSLSKLFKFSIKNESSVSFFDSTNHSFYFLSKDSIYKNNLNLNTLKTEKKENKIISLRNNLINSNDNIDEVYIYDILGSKVISEENYKGTVFHLNSLNPGFYLYRVKTGNKYYTGKFIIEK